MHLCPETSILNSKYLNQEKLNPLVHDPSSLFTENELSIIHLMLQDKKSLEISKIKFRSVRTIEAIRRKIYKKMGVKSAVGFVVKCIRLGIAKFLLKSILFPLWLMPDLISVEFITDLSFL